MRTVQRITTWKEMSKNNNKDILVHADIPCKALSAYFICEESRGVSHHTRLHRGWNSTGGKARAEAFICSLSLEKQRIQFYSCWTRRSTEFLDINSEPNIHGWDKETIIFKKATVQYEIEVSTNKRSCCRQVKSTTTNTTTTVASKWLHKALNKLASFIFLTKTKFGI